MKKQRSRQGNASARIMRKRCYHKKILGTIPKIRGGSRTAATSKMERFDYFSTVNYYRKALHLGCCSSPRSASEDSLGNERFC